MLNNKTSIKYNNLENPPNPLVKGESRLPLLKGDRGDFRWFLALYHPFAVNVFLVLYLLGCAGRSNPEVRPAAVSQELYIKSQKELKNANYKGAYNYYQKAVAKDPGIADVSYLSSILYAWALSESAAEDIPILSMQKRVWLEPSRLEIRRELLLSAIDREKGIIYAFGIGIASQNVSSSRLMARKAAVADSLSWVARIAKWSKSGVECPYDISQTVSGYEILKESWIGEMIYVVKVKAPIDCLGGDVKIEIKPQRHQDTKVTKK